MDSHSRKTGGFTLVEMLTVIVIIGILAAILIPTVTSVIKRGKVTRISTELSQLQNAIEQYKNDFHDYPPDFTNWAVVNRHIRKRFPQIDPTEIQALQNEQIDCAEALVFWLDGFSDDKRFPFSGPGGPLNRTTERNKGIFEFIPSRLTKFLADPSTGLPSTNNAVQTAWSNDEELYHGQMPAQNDAFPVYLPPGVQVPYVYFEWRTYIHNPINNINNQAVPPSQFPPTYYMNTTAIAGVARPYRDSREQRIVRPNDFDPVAFEFVGKETFQLICAGLNNDYGQDIVQTSPNDHRAYPSGRSYNEGDNENITNFSEGNTLENRIP